MEREKYIKAKKILEEIEDFERNLNIHSKALQSLNYRGINLYDDERGITFKFSYEDCISILEKNIRYCKNMLFKLNNDFKQRMII